MGFGHIWRGWIKECVCSAFMSVLINGSPTKPFKMKRGLRQVDPLSPFLFVLVVDMLHRMIREAVRNGRIYLLLVGRDNIELSHLQFADDTILFCPTEEDTIRNYKRLLHCFELMSRLSINFEKSSFIQVNSDRHWSRKMCQLLGCKEESLPVRYLGISLGANPRLVKTWKPVIDKVEDKLSLWKVKTLNKAGKLVLIKSVLNSLPIYYLNLYKMLKAVAEKLISLQRRFLCSKENGRNGIPLVKWEVVMAPKKAGGMRIGDAVIRNTVLLFKWWWRFSKEDCPLWKKVVCSCNNLNSNEMLCGQPGMAEQYGSGRISGYLTVFLKSCFQDFSRSQTSKVLQEVVLPEEITSYSFTSAIWKGFVPPRIELFSWFVLVGRVNTKDRLCRLGVINPNDRTCVLCGKSVESALHLFAGCEISWQVWCAWLFALGRKWTMPGTLKQHFESWTNTTARRGEKRRWVIGFFAVIWTVWLERNDRIFRNQSSHVVDIISRSFLLSDEWSGGESYGY
ncbi:uncharacterized protein LOC130981788 [Arachis stenosperma]|uniref:uncharacterized protein LOC130981788 n=1 Tax=Arachis stenosperma TaxID=217475 RepID=UPI0025ACC3B9|nr:uncharacterized protein LOC130981788 [Arachis stenosperma]